MRKTKLVIAFLIILIAMIVMVLDLLLLFLGSIYPNRKRDHENKFDFFEVNASH